MTIEDIKMEELDNNSLENQALQLTLLDFLFQVEEKDEDRRDDDE